MNLELTENKLKTQTSCLRNLISIHKALYPAGVLVEGSAFSCTASPFCWISTKHQEGGQFSFYIFLVNFLYLNLKKHKHSLLVGGELWFVRFSCSITNPSSTTVNSPVWTMPFLFSKESFNISFTFSTRKKKIPI